MFLISAFPRSTSVFIWKQRHLLIPVYLLGLFCLFASCCLCSLWISIFKQPATNCWIIPGSQIISDQFPLSLSFAPHSNYFVRNPDEMCEVLWGVFVWTCLLVCKLHTLKLELTGRSARPTGRFTVFFSYFTHILFLIPLCLWTQRPLKKIENSWLGWHFSGFGTWLVYVVIRWL